MNMHRYNIIAICVITCMFIISCGSGTDSTTANPIPYTGSTETAIINVANAADMVKLSYDAGHAGMQVINAVTRSLQEAEANDSPTGDSDCPEWPGTYRISGSTSAGATRVWMDIVYDDYCYEDNNEYFIINGLVKYELNDFAFNETTDYMFYPVDIAIRNASNNALKNDFTLAGNIEAYKANSSAYTVITEDYTIRDNSAAIPLPIYKVKYYIDEEILTPLTLSNNISGQFSHHIEGVTSISTPDSLIYLSGILPDSGIFRIKGLDNKGARINFESNASIVEIDVDGDGTYPDTTTIIW